MGIYKILNSDKTVAVASLELADLAAEQTYIDESEDNLFIYDDDQDGTVYTIKGYRRSHIIPYNRGVGRRGKYSSERIVKWTLKLDKAIIWAPEDNGKTTKSTATISGSALASAIIPISVGPANKSIPTFPNKILLASATN